MHPQTQPPSSQPRFLWRYTAAVLASLMVTDPFLLAAPPAWWTNTAHPERNVTPSTLAAQRDDFSAANIGQLKTLARKAMQAMDDAWPGYGAGPAVHSMAAAWDSPAAAGVTRDDYAAVNAGQLKSVAKPFYDRLIQLGHRPPNAYPWSSSTASRDDYALVNIGQVKSLFSFEIPPQFLPHTDQGVSTHQGLTAVQSMLATYQQMLANLAMLNTLLASWQTMKDNLDALRDLLWALADEAAQLGDNNTLDQIQDVINDLNGTASAMPRAPGIHLQVQLRHVLDSWGMSSLDGQPIYQHAETRMLESWVRLNGGPIWDRLMPTDGVISYHWPMYVPGEFPPDELPVGPGDQTLVSTWMDVPVSAMSTLAKYVEMPTVSVAGSYVSLSGTVSVQECRVRLHADGPLDSPHTESFLLLSRKGNYSPDAFDPSVMDQIRNHALGPSSFYSPASIFDYGDIPPPDTVTPGTPGGPAVITLTIEKNATTSLPARVPAPQPDLHDPAVPANGAKMMDVALLPVEVKVVKKGESSAPEKGLVVKKGDTLEISCSSGDSESFPIKPSRMFWLYSKRKMNGDWGVWSVIPGNNGARFDYTVQDAGVYRFKVFFSGIHSSPQDDGYELLRTKDEKLGNEPYGFGKIGQFNCVGVAENQRDLDIVLEAQKFLGSTDYAPNKIVPAQYGFPAYGTTGNQIIRCNIFVAHRATAAGATVPKINGYTFEYPPIANQWAGIADTSWWTPAFTSEIDGWQLWKDLSFMPMKPGCIIAHPVPDDAGHCAIVDYDGEGIGSGMSGTVNKKYPDFFDGTSGYRKYEP